MKKLLFIAGCYVAPLKLMAYYESYSSPEIEIPGWILFCSVIMIVWGILEIILFFKLWGMTNDVKALKRQYFSELKFPTRRHMVRYIRKNLLLGYVDDVKHVLLQNFKKNVEDHMGTSLEYGYEEGLRNRFDEDITPYVKNLEKQYNKLGFELPTYIARMKTFGDFYGIFVEKDLIVDIQD